VFEAGEQNSPNAVTKEKAAEIAADFTTTFYRVQIGALEDELYWRILPPAQAEKRCVDVPGTGVVIVVCPFRVRAS
jgi:hypothetical protein